MSAHGESGGTTCCSALVIARALRSELQEELDEGMRIIVGMDSNVKEPRSNNTVAHNVFTYYIVLGVAM